MTPDCEKTAFFALFLLLPVLLLASLPPPARAAEGAGPEPSSPEPAAQQEAPLSVAVFKFELIDTSGDTTPANLEAQPKRIDLISHILRDELARSGRYRLVPIQAEGLPLDKATIERALEGNLSGCPGCDVEVAQALGADLSITATVQKVSNLILNLNVYVRDTRTGGLLAVHSVDIRGNTDDSWTRGVKYLLKNRLLRDSFGAPEAGKSP